MIIFALPHYISYVVQVVQARAPCTSRIKATWGATLYHLCRTSLYTVMRASSILCDIFPSWLIIQSASSASTHAWPGLDILVSIKILLSQMSLSNIRFWISYSSFRNSCQYQNSLNLSTLWKVASNSLKQPLLIFWLQ